MTLMLQTMSSKYAWIKTCEIDSF